MLLLGLVVVLKFFGPPLTRVRFLLLLPRVHRPEGEDRCLSARCRALWGCLWPSGSESALPLCVFQPAPKIRVLAPRDWAGKPAVV